MAENPLLPNAELRALYRLLQRACRLEPAASASGSAGDRRSPALAGKRAAGGTARSAAVDLEALLAATLLQVRPKDVVVADDLTEAISSLLQAATPAEARQPRATVQGSGFGDRKLLFATGLASALRHSGDSALVLLFVRPGAEEESWAVALEWAQRELLPLIVVYADRSGSEALRAGPANAAGALDWGTLQRTAGRLKLPVLTVDGADSVAVYRVMQESVLRARAQGGPAVLWAVLPEPKGRRQQKRKDSSLSRLEHYLQTRNIAVP